MASKMLSFLAKLDDNEIVEFSKRDEFKQALNSNPPSEWVKRNRYANDSEYLPIDKVEGLLDSIFQEWQVEIKSVTQLAQSICAIVRLHYKDPINHEWRFHDGVGATPLKTNKGASASDLSQIQSSAVATGAPAAVSFAIKDAAEHIGNLFGKNLNRKDTAETTSIYAIEEKNRAAKELNHKQTIAGQILFKEAQAKDKFKANLTESMFEAKEMTIKELDEFLKAHGELENEQA